jgi:hypothetical protein
MLTTKEIQDRFKAASIQEAKRPSLKVTFKASSGITSHVFTFNEIYGSDLFPAYKFLIDGREEGIRGANYNHPTMGWFTASLVYPPTV